MSRIDEALRRAGTDHHARSRVAATVPDTHRSPWQFDEDADAGAQPAPEPQAPAAAPAGSGSPLDLARREATGLVDGFNSKWAGRLVVSPKADWMLVEQFRRLAATLHQAQIDANTRTVMVTSAAPGDGKTLTAINLALTLSESYRRRVLLIDADLRRPSIRDVSHMPNVLGLSDGLRTKTDQQLTVLPITKNLMLLPAGRPDPDPMGGLTSSRMRRILDDAVRHFEWVILDAPPIGGIADTSLLGGMVDAALLVLRAGQTRCAMAQNAINALGRDRILGVVLNGATMDEQPAYTYAAYGTPTATEPHEA